MRIALVFALWATAAVGAALAQIDTSQPLLPQQQLIPMDGFPASAAANYQAWFNYLVVRSWVEHPRIPGVSTSCLRQMHTTYRGLSR